jgi:GTP pyrophosphokinase
LIKQNRKSLFLYKKLKMASFTPEEDKFINDEFEKIFQFCKGCKDGKNEELIRKSFELANKAHYGIRRRSGEPYIHHPIAVAQIVAQEIGLGTKSVISSILHDVVEDTDYTISDIERLFGSKIANIIDGLTKISGNFDALSMQAENFRKMLMTLSEDVRVVFIKLADRLHNMRTLESMPEEKQQKIASETIFIYAPLAHRLGLYAIKTELEDLSLKFHYPTVFQEITEKIQATEKQRLAYINKFTMPIINKIGETGIDYSITGRPKSVYSIWNKMQTKGVPFEEVFDLFAIRIVFNPTSPELEKRESWSLYSIITDIYQPNPDRLRDWVSTPKANGYEALHTTLMGPEGKWVEVQIRTKRMDEIAERGYAAHWKYKGSNDTEGELDKWIKEISKLLETPESDALEFLDEFKMSLFTSEIYVFTPKGLLRRIPKGSTALDFAYDVHTNVGNRAIGAKINHKLVALSSVLNSGDQVEILTSEKQLPQREWLEFVITAKAKSKIKDSFKFERKNNIEKGKELLEKKFDELNIIITSNIYRKLLAGFETKSKDDLYCKIGRGIIDLKSVNKILANKSKNKWIKYWQLQIKKTTTTKKKKTENANKTKKVELIDNVDGTNFTIAQCCKPIPGDDIIGYIDENDKIIIHKRKCEKAVKLMTEFGDKILTPEWKSQKIYSYLASISLSGIDKIGIVNRITELISKDLQVNMRSIYFNSTDGVFDGRIDLYLYNTYDLDKLITDLKKINGVNKVIRVGN